MCYTPKIWSGWPESNRSSRVWKTPTLPLSYSRDTYRCHRLSSRNRSEYPLAIWRLIWHTRTVKMLRYIELKSGHSDNGPAWIAYVTPSKTGRTLYFNGRGLMKLKGQRRGESGGNYVDMETGESFWVSGVKLNGQDRHWAGSGKVLIEASAVTEYLKTIKATTLDTSRCEVTDSIRQTDIERLSQLANSPSQEFPHDPKALSRYSFVRNVTSSPK